MILVFVPVFGTSRIYGMPEVGIAASWARRTCIMYICTGYMSTCICQMASCELGLANDDVYIIAGAV